MMKQVTVEQKGTKNGSFASTGGFGSDPLSFKRRPHLRHIRLHTGDSDTYDHRTAWLGYRLIFLLTRDVLYATSDGAT